MTPIKEWFCNWCRQTISLPSSFQDDSRLVCIFFTSLANNDFTVDICSSTCSTFIFARVWMFTMYLKTVFGVRWRCQETGQCTRRDGGGGVVRAGQQLCSRATIFSSVQGKGGLSPTEWPSTRHSCPETLHEGLTFTIGAFSHIPGLCILIGCFSLDNTGCLSTGALMS